MTPAGVFELTKRNHKVYIQTQAGVGSGFFDDDYKSVGATILQTIEEVYEPFLLQEGFIMRTPRGREVTHLAYKHLGRVKGENQGELF